MKITIAHGKTKREINGPFAICCSNIDLKELKSIIDSAIERNISYGWINFDEFIAQPEGSDFDIIKRQKPIANTEPVGWD